ncbi:MAG: ABC transporter permease, partial [Chloroflexi bacterium]|nr:ABC transporter permease [Chloroflexota bacterium]
MTTVAGARPPGQRFPLAWTISDTVTMTWRNLLNVVRQPQLIVFSTIQPIIFVLLFRYVFGGAIRPPGAVSYVDFLMPGIFIQTMAFGSINTGVGLAEDIRKGLIERFRSLPMARSAVLAGRTSADLIRDVWVIGLMLAVGFAVGFRVHTNVFQFIGGMGVLLLFGFAMIWVFGLIGMFTQNGETAQAASFPIMAILVFASSAFVPTETMPHWLRLYTEHQPLSATANAVRALTIGGPATTKVL